MHVYPDAFSHVFRSDGCLAPRVVEVDVGRGRFVDRPVTADVGCLALGHNYRRADSGLDECAYCGDEFWYHLCSACLEAAEAEQK